MTAIGHYWFALQAPYPNAWPPPQQFTEIGPTKLDETSQWLARRLGEAAAKSGYRHDHVAFVTAYQDRGSAAFKKTVSRLAWGSFAWFATEPDHLLVQYESIAGDVLLSDILDPRSTR